MKFKAILIFTAFFIGTPIMLGQTGLPSLPDAPTVPNVSLPSGSSIPSLPSTPSLSDIRTPSVPTALPLDSLRNAGISTSSLTDPQALRDQIPNQGILSNAFSTPLPNRDNAAELAKELAKRTFPEEFNAAQGKISGATSMAQSGEALANNARDSASSFQTPSLSDATGAARSVLPTSLSTPTLPTTPTLPATPTFTPPSL